MQFDPFEREYILGALLSYAEMGNPISADIHEILTQKLEMHPLQAVYPNRPPITMWIHTSIFLEGIGMVFNTPETVAIALNPAFEGEYYCTLNPLDKEPLKKCTDDYLRTVGSPTFPLAQAIKKRQQELKERQEAQKSEYNIFFKVKKLCSLAEKLKKHRLSQCV